MYFTNDSSTELNVLDLSRNKARVILRLMDSKFIQRFAYDSTNGNIAVLTSDNVLSYYTYEHERGLSLKWKHEAFLDNDGWSCRSDSGLSAVDGQVTSAWTEPVRTGKAVLHTIVAANDSKHSYQFAVDEEPNGMNSYPGLIQIRGFNLEKRRVDAAYVGSTGKPVKHPLPTYNNGSRILGFTVANGELEFVSSHVDSDEVKRTQIATIEQPRERIVASKKATAVMGNMFCSVMYLDKEKGCYLAYSTLDSQRSGLIKLHQSPRFLYMTSADTACCAFDDKVVKYQLK
ncbi:MAG: hypothetical protein U5N86_05050 [Planctomycetota bacterium]|nr:hypothetical protein [Planctomycetota bacterium]